MSISCRVLGAPGRDNALLVRVDGGQAFERFLFDCGEDCLDGVAVAEIQAIDHLFFSHLHLDHVAGFDTFFRATHARATVANRIWGPPQTARILQHRFQGFLWNLAGEMAGTWRVADIDDHHVRTTRFELSEAFAIAHDEGALPRERVVCAARTATVEAVALDHRTPVLAYVVRERPRVNVDEARLRDFGLAPGPWLQRVKDPRATEPRLVVGGVEYDLADLRAKLLVETPGESVAYLTDFRLDDAARDRLSAVLAGCETVICEAQYLHADLDLAWRNHHLTAVEAAELAALAGIGQLVLIHVSDRYSRDDRPELLREAQRVFARTTFPPHWDLA